ncbi:MAG: PP2C family protein-serine/threonine phosphatase [Candidatus Acidiferrales bacterium]
MNEATKMATASEPFLRQQLEVRRSRLEEVRLETDSDPSVEKLIEEVDSALARMAQGTFGICEACHDPVEAERLLADPLTRVCIDHLDEPHRRALEADLELAGRVQRGLLPERNLLHAGWQIHFLYEPAGPVSGDYCDIIPGGQAGDTLFFVLGDVAGKGVSASMLMTHLHAMFRSLTSVGMPLSEMLHLANRLFSESTTAAQYATLICGWAKRSGEIEIANAGHCAALILRGEAVEKISATGLPLGMFSDARFTSRRMNLATGDSLVLYTDGLTEAAGAAGKEYGLERLSGVVSANSKLEPQKLAHACLSDLKNHTAGAARADDLTLMVFRRLANA